MSELRAAQGSWEQDLALTSLMHAALQTSILGGLVNPLTMDHRLPLPATRISDGNDDCLSLVCRYW